MALDLLVVRHGKTDWNAESRVMGHRPIPLNETGRAQARHLREWLHGIEIHAAYTSPMKRAVQTAEIALEGRNGFKIELDEGLSEIDYGDWVGLTFDEVEKQFPDSHNDYRYRTSIAKIPGGEAVVDVQKRIVATVERIRQKHDGQRVLIVSHADVIKSLFGHYLNFSLDQLQRIGCDNGSISIYRFGTAWGDRLVALNYFADVKKILPW